MKDIVNFLFEMGILSKTPRSFHQLLFSGDQSVAEHTNRVVYIGYALASLEKENPENKDLDMLKVLKMCLLHDIGEARVSDLHYVHQKYVTSHEDKAVDDLANTLPFGEDIKKIIKEYESRTSKESIIAKDADTLEFILSLKEQIDTGNTRAESWVRSAVKRLKTKLAKEIAVEILKTPSDDWWFHDKDDKWWINRGKE